MMDRGKLIFMLFFFVSTQIMFWLGIWVGATYY